MGLLPARQQLRDSKLCRETIAYVYFRDGAPTTTGGKRHLNKTDAEAVALAMLRLPEVMGWKG
jgi:hypothetical protein